MRQLATALRRAGLRPGERVAFVAPNFTPPAPVVPVKFAPVITTEPPPPRDPDVGEIAGAKRLLSG